jgi:uncharacterized protein YkuJ
MTHNLSLGAINKQTGEYVYPKIANKKDDYICPDCNKELILCQGGIIRPYFRHKVDSVNPCHHYSNPTESQIHKDGKMVIKSLLERKILISFIRNCCSCKKNEEYEMPGMTESSKIELEYRFEYNGTKIADVVYIDNGDILCIFEICNTHKTCSENRPEPWFEIDAETLIKLANDNSFNSLKIPDIRCEKCEKCNEIDKLKQKYKDININKYYAGYDKKTTLDFTIKCELYIDDILVGFEKFNDDKEINVKRFEKCYYDKYYKAISSIKNYGNNWNGHANWGGWGGKLYGSTRVDGCLKLTMQNFMKYYKLINPVTIIENMKSFY